MMATITAAEFHDRLVQAGHLAAEGEEPACASDIWPTRETIVTVAMNLDPTLRPAYRQRYFACLLWSEENQVPALRDEPAFALPERFRELEPAPTEDPFVGGSFRWLLKRLVRSDQILLGPACKYPESGPAFTNQELPDQVPELRGMLPADPSDRATLGAVVLDLDQPSTCRLLYQVANEVSQAFDVFCVSDLNGREVYRLHHHGKVVVSIPDDLLRKELLDDLASWSELIEDCSGYVLESDEEDDE